MKARLFSICTAAAALAAAPLGVAHAQYDTNMNGAPSKYTFELYLAQYSFEGGNDGRTGIGGIGGRVMFGRGDATKVVSTFFNRARAGVFAVYTAEQKDITTFHVGGQADFPLFAAPVANGFLDPFVSLGAGLFRQSVDVIGADNSSNNFALTPAVGTLIPLTGAIKFRGDIRDAIVFNDGNASNNWLFEGGISIGF